MFIRSIKRPLKILLLIVVFIMILWIILFLFIRYFNFKPYCESSGGKWIEAIGFTGTDVIFPIRKCDCFYQMAAPNCEETFDFDAKPSLSTEKQMIKEITSFCSYKPEILFFCSSCKNDDDCKVDEQSSYSIQRSSYEIISRPFCDAGVCRVKRTIYALPSFQKPVNNSESNFRKLIN